MQLHFTRMLYITARRSYASAVLGVVILSVCSSVCLSVRLSHACFVTNPKNLPSIFLLCHILITANMQSNTGFPSSHQLKSYVAPKSRLKFAACCPVSGCGPSCTNRVVNTWNSLPNWVVSANTTSTFETILYKFWHNQDIVYNVRAQVQGTGSHSKFLYEES